MLLGVNDKINTLCHSRRLLALFNYLKNSLNMV